MVDEIKGNIELKNALPYGTIKKITETFGYKSQGNVSEVIAGNKKGNTLLIECAEKIVTAYEDCGFEEKITEILKGYDVSK
ncbi:hypothetical protein H9I45_14965 [Polaribacter haliotis]|uniref:Uncharacterized protein n=1 Tax=Polaribacter haliotis TaxID=1888915 RepID=A0A7L8AFM6_9FLAO|nr:hypothetical protein [Polaribacter haliotis]QOD60619.1 hypothetical protein H9I45_14965 [Polaribacter haliotis]